MPKQARIGALKALQNIIVRGIERCKIFKDDADLDKIYSPDYAWQRKDQSAGRKFIMFLGGL